MVSGAQKVWINSILRAGPSAVLGTGCSSFNKTECNEPLSHALARRCAEAVCLKAALFSLSSIKRFVGVPEPAVFVGVAVGEVAENHEKVSLRMAQ
jgi:hypothetical protein